MEISFSLWFDIASTHPKNLCFLQFHSQAQDSRRPPDSRIPFEYCYDMRSILNPIHFPFSSSLKTWTPFCAMGSPGENTSLIPSMSLTMKGGSQFPVYDPIIIISSQVGPCSYQDSFIASFFLCLLVSL